MGSYTYPRYPYRKPPPPGDAPVPVAIVGAGLVGLTLALDLALKGVPSVVLDEDDTVSLGSRSICQARRTLEIWHRLGVAERVVAKGVTWDTGEVNLRDRPVYRFDLTPEPGQRFPAFVNLQQYYCEQYLVERCLEQPLVDLRFRHKVVGVGRSADRAYVDVETPDGNYALTAAWLVACDGVRSSVRRALDLPFEGEVFDDQFLIADIRMRTALPNVRKFWFHPPFHPEHSVLLHRQADDVLRVDFQLGRGADPEIEKKPENIDRRLRAMFGPDAAWDHEWISLYTFSCRTMRRYVEGRVVFAGDAAHVVSPFGARGGNGGVADADNLGWKLAAVLRDGAPDSLIGTYGVERLAAARENIRQSTRSTDFIAPKFPASRVFRDATLALAHDVPFARALVNSGRLSRPVAYETSPLNIADTSTSWGVAPAPGASFPDAPLDGNGPTSMIEAVAGRFAIVVFVERTGELSPEVAAAIAALDAGSLPVARLLVTRDIDSPDFPGWTILEDIGNLAFRRCDARRFTTFLVRPDQHVAGRWRRIDPAALADGLRRLLAGGPA